MDLCYWEFIVKLLCNMYMSRGKIEFIIGNYE